MGGKLRYGRDNLLAVKVTCPWLPKDRALAEIMRGQFQSHFLDPGLSKLPDVLGGGGHGAPAEGNAVFPLGICVT